MSQRAEMEAVLEAILFAAPDPVSPDKLLELFPKEGSEAVEEALASVRARYVEEPHRGIIAEAGGRRRSGSSPARRCTGASAQVLRGLRPQPSLDGRILGDPGHRRLSPAGHRAGDPGAS